MAGTGRLEPSDGLRPDDRFRRSAEARDSTDGLPLTVRERSFVLRPPHGKVCPCAVIAPTALPNPARRLWCGRGPDPTIMRGYRQSEFLQRRYIVQIERAAVQLLKVIPADREPERHSLVRIAGVHPDERIGRPLVAGEHQYPASLVAIPVIEEEIRAP